MHADSLVWYSSFRTAVCCDLWRGQSKGCSFPEMVCSPRREKTFQVLWMLMLYTSKPCWLSTLPVYCTMFMDDARRCGNRHRQSIFDGLCAQMETVGQGRQDGVFVKRLWSSSQLAMKGLVLWEDKFYSLIFYDPSLPAKWRLHWSNEIKLNITDSGLSKGLVGNVSKLCFGFRVTLRSVVWISLLRLLAL